MYICRKINFKFILKCEKHISNTGKSVKNTDTLYVQVSLFKGTGIIYCFPRRCCNSSYGKAKTAYGITPTIGHIFLIFLVNCLGACIVMAGVGGVG